MKLHSKYEQQNFFTEKRTTTERECEGNEIRLGN